MLSRNPLPLLAFALLWLIMLLAGGSGSGFDPAILTGFYAGDRPWLASAAAVLTQLGGWIVLTLVSAGAAAMLLMKGKRRDALLLLLIGFGGRLLIDIQKYVSARARPEEEHLVAVHSLSFPSGHSANSMIVYLAAALLLSGRRWAVISALLLAVAIGLSRLVLGVHWPSDVVGGWAFGLLWTLGLLRFARSGRTLKPAS